jgi:hypothetical protein
LQLTVLGAIRLTRPAESAEQDPRLPDLIRGYLQDVRPYMVSGEGEPAMWLARTGAPLKMNALANRMLAGFELAGLEIPNQLQISTLNNSRRGRLGEIAYARSND